MTKSTQSLRIIDLGGSAEQMQERLHRVRSQITGCVSKARHYVKLIELLDEKVEELSCQEEELLLLLEKKGVETIQ